ncbi:MAG: thiopurine S-methyltransferase [Gammaproteobacteria bacterium]|nr:thiopurine S-methyltransferase [Gammaproteobacteria bacterium]
MEPEFWHQRWSENRLGFHQQKINSRLRKFWPGLGIPRGAGVFVPLCGKSLDMLWLAEQGYRVLGIELSRAACEAFFVENGIAYRAEARGHFTGYVSESITLYAGDFFDLSADDLDAMRGVYDRAALIALPQAMRPGYAGHMADILPPGCRGLLISMTYDEQKMQGPPFSVGEEEVRELFEPGFSVDLISESSGPDIVGNLRERGLDTLDEKVYRLAKPDRSDKSQ